MEITSNERPNVAFLLFAAVGLVSGCAIKYSGGNDLNDAVWSIGIMPVLIAPLIEIAAASRRPLATWGRFRLSAG